MSSQLVAAFLTSTLSPAAGGLSASVPGLAKALWQECGVDVHVVGAADPSNETAAALWGPNVHAYTRFGPSNFGFAPGLEKALARISPSIVDMQGLWTFSSLVNIRNHLKCGTPYVITPRGMLDPWARRRSRWKKQIVRFLFEDRHLAGASCLRATAFMEAEHFRSLGLSNPIAVVPNGVEIPPRSKLLSSQPRRRILFLSRIHPKKGIEFLLRAWATIEPYQPDWDLVIAGPDEVGHTQEMQALACRLRLSRVLWLPAVHGEAKSELYRSAECLVLPTHAENFGLVVAEALAHEIPVITTKNAPWQELQEHRCGWWIDLDVNALATALFEATLLPRVALHEMGARGRDWMERDFGWGGIAQKMLTVYDCILRGDRLPESIRFD